MIQVYNSYSRGIRIESWGYWLSWFSFLWFSYFLQLQVDAIYRNMSWLPFFQTLICSNLIISFIFQSRTDKPKNMVRNSRFFLIHYSVLYTHWALLTSVSLRESFNELQTQEALVSAVSAKYMEIILWYFLWVYENKALPVFQHEDR
jgi:hypothetical protein